MEMKEIKVKEVPRMELTKEKYDLANLFCDVVQEAGVDCHECPAYKYCERGQNGFMKWLDEKVEVFA